MLYGQGGLFVQVENIRVEMLGGFSVWVNGQQIVEDAAKLTKPWQLFCYLGASPGKICIKPQTDRHAVGGR